jgi:succinate-semialdehyde dehydrogenase/glutarate-semialdehyde dehydrogenase
MEHFINGKWHAPNSGEYVDVTNPCTGEVIGRFARGNEADVKFSLEDSQRAFHSWKKTPTAERAKLQHHAADLMREKVDELSQILSTELGRPLAGCKREIERSAELLDFYAEEGLRLKGAIPLNNIEGEKVMVIRQPIGVVVAITPFNYPITLLTFKLGAALMTGCTITAKPSEDTPLSTLRLAEIFTEAGYPAGVFNVITGYGREIGDALVTSPIPSKIGFTGGTSTGKHIARLATGTNKRITLELGGQSPAVVCEDTDLDVACPAIVRHAFSNSGQFCYRVNRIYVHENLYAEFLERIKTLTEKLVVCDAKQPDCDMGPMVNEKIFRNSEQQVADALGKGARLVTGGKRLTGSDYDKGWYFPPTILADTNHEMEIMTEETFGPVIGVMPFKENDHAIELANDSRYGLAAYLFTKNIGQAITMSEALEAGSVWVNNIRRSYHNVPFGGVKESGVGREKSSYGLEAYTELKTIYLNY